MVELFEGDIRDDGRKSSKGKQLKWQKEDIWYKADYLGYEGLCKITDHKGDWHDNRYLRSSQAAALI